jgi:hypothetical protein
MTAFVATEAEAGLFITNDGTIDEVPASAN